MIKKPIRFGKTDQVAKATLKRVPTSTAADTVTETTYLRSTVWNTEACPARSRQKPGFPCYQALLTMTAQ
jgi:hypothetical protein